MTYFSVPFRIQVYNVMPAVVVPTVNEHCVKYVVCRVFRVVFLQKLIKG